MARPTFDSDRKTLLSKLRRAKASLGNLALRAELGWNENRYWKVRDSLLEDGLIERGRGRGGSVKAA